MPVVLRFSMGRWNSLGNSPPHSSCPTPPLWSWSSGSGVQAHSLNFCGFLGGCPAEGAAPAFAPLPLHQTQSLALWSIRKKTKGLDRWRQGKQIPREVAQCAASLCVQAAPCQPGPPYWNYGVVRMYLSVLHSPLLRLCFDRCVQGWHGRRCQLSPGWGRGAGGRPGGSAQPAVLPQVLKDVPQACDLQEAPCSA